MKKCCTLLSLICLIFFTDATFAQMVGDNVFLQGAFVEVGIAPNGGYGSTLPAPTGYHPYLGTGVTFTFFDPLAGVASTSANFLGFVADYGADGWTVGTPPFFGDFYLPGDPQEGWAIEINGRESDAYIPIYETIPTTGFTGSLSGTNVSYSNTGGIIKGVWQGAVNAGTDSALSIRQTTTIDTTKLYFTVNVVLTNTGTVPLTNIYYLRTVDPDNDETRVPGEYTTINTITDQLPNPGNKVLVSATGVTYTNAYLGLGTKDCRAKCVIYNGAGLIPGFSVDSIYNERENLVGEDYLYTQGTGDVSDVGIGLAFQIGTIAPGDSTALSYTYILNATYIDSALNSITPQFQINTTLADSTDSVNVCAFAGDSINVFFPGGGFYTWTFFPDSFVHTITGTHFSIPRDSIKYTENYTIIGANVAGGCDSIFFHLKLNFGQYTASSAATTSYCQGVMATPLTSPVLPGSDTIVTWYTTPTGGGASSTAPTPPTATATTLVYYFVDSVPNFCVSRPIPDTVVIEPMPTVPGLSDPNPYCQGQPFVPITALGSNIQWYAGPTGGFPTTVAPIVNTFIPQTDTFYATQTLMYTTPNALSCEGPRGTIAITVLDSIVPLFTYAIHYGCKGDTVAFNNTSRGAMRYVWEFGDGSSDTVTNPWHVYLLQDTFTVKMTAITQQCNDSLVETVPLVHPLQASFTFAPNVVCQKDTAVFTNTSIGTGLSYRWLFGNGATNDSVNTSYSYLNSGVYQVMLIATDFVPCHDTAIGTISIDSISPISMIVTDSVICKSTDITFTGNFTGIGNTGVTWNFGDGDSIKNINPVSHAYEASGPYTVTVTAHYRACKDTGTSRRFTIFAAPSVNLGSDTTICPGSEPITLSDNINAENTLATWTWSTGQTTPSITIVAPGKYYVTVHMNGCGSTDTITVLNDCYMDIPNVFTPNGDGLNDYFYPRQLLTKGLISFKMDIYNRWGQLVFETTTLDGAGWDGKLNGVDQPEGVFVYVIDAKFKDGQKEHHNGNVTLLR